MIPGMALRGRHATPRRVCFLATVALLLFLKTADGAADGDAYKQDYSCEAISKVPAEQQCRVIREQCPSESLIPYAEWYFCYLAPRNVLLRSLYLVAVCCLLPLAFCLLGDTAEFYIAPIMAHVSQAIPKMRPRFAGVTFVALGNGAPDLSANIAAISAGEVVLSAGAFTGAAMFVQCVVAAELVSLAGDSGIKCGGAMLRDVGVYCLAITSVLLAFSLGQISRVFVGWCIALYVLYMIWVFAGDEWHQRGRPKPQLDGQSFKALLSRITSRGAVTEAVNGPPRRSSGGGSSRSAVGYSSRDDLEESLLPWVVAEYEEVTATDFDRYNGMVVGLQAGAMGGPPPEFEAQLPFPMSPGRPGPHGDLGSGVVGGLGSRPASLTSQAVQQRSTEMSAVAGAFRGAASAAAPGSHGGSGRRVSAPSFPTGANSSGGSGGGGAADWASSTSLQVQRHASESLPILSPLAAMQQQQQQRQQAGSFSPIGYDVRQQAASSSSRQGHVGHPHVMSLGKQSFIDPKTYKQLVWADLADDEEEEARLEREIARQLLVGAGRSRGAGTGTAAAGSYQPPSIQTAAASPSHASSHQQLLSPDSTTPRTPADAQQAHTQHLQQQQQQQFHRQAGMPEGEDGASFSPFGSGAFRTGPNTPRSAEGWPAGGPWDASEPSTADKGFAEGRPGPAAGLRGPSIQQHSAAAVEAGQQLQAVREQDGGGAGDVWQQLQWQVTLGNSEEWVDAGPVRQLFRKVTFPLLLPAYLGQRLTIPFASASGYSREWLISSLLCFPLALIAYLGLLTLPGVLIACGVGITAAVLGAVMTAWDEPGQMAVQGLGGKAAAAVPGVLAVLAFCMGVVWIDTIATEVVGIITFLAGLASLPSGVMGLTLLAWGNSLGDYFGNRAMAKAGHTSTAITACFAAPLFNMLISLACGFSSYLHKLGTTSVKVPLTPEVALGCVFLICYNIAIVVVGKLCGWRLPPWFRHFSRAWYGLYFTLAVASGFYQQHSSRQS